MAEAHPNVDPDMNMYWPRVLMTPDVPAPYRKMLTVPATVSIPVLCCWDRHPIVPYRKPMMAPTATEESELNNVRQCEEKTYCHPSSHPL